MYACGTCNDTYCSGCEEDYEEANPELDSLADHQPAREPMTLDEYEDRMMEAKS